VRVSHSETFLANAPQFDGQALNPYKVKWRKLLNAQVGYALENKEAAMNRLRSITGGAGRDAGAPMILY